MQTNMKVRKDYSSTLLETKYTFIIKEYVNSSSQPRSTMQDLLETFSEPIPDFTPLYLPHQGKYLAPPPHGLLAGYLDPRAFHSLDSGYGMIPYAATLHAIPPHMDPYSTPLAAIAAMDKQGNFLSLSEKFPPPSSIPVPKGPSTAAKERRR